MKEYLLFRSSKRLHAALPRSSSAACSVAFFISHLSPISPVDQIIGRVIGQVHRQLPTPSN